MRSISEQASMYAPLPLSSMQGQPLLVAKGVSADAAGRLLLPLSNGSAVLPDLSVSGRMAGGCRFRAPRLHVHGTQVSPSGSSGPCGPKDH